MKVAFAQVNPTVGDFAGNVERCLAAAISAKARGAELLLLPGMALPGSPPRDLLFDPSFVEASLDATRDLARRCEALLPVVVGSLGRASEAEPDHPGLLQVAYLLRDGEATPVGGKRCLESGGGAFESRWFLPAKPFPPFLVQGHTLGVVMGEEVLRQRSTACPAHDLKALGAEALLCLGASPFQRGLPAERRGLAGRIGLPLLFANLSGGNDEVLYDGSSFALGADGKLLAALPSFEEGVAVVELGTAHSTEATSPDNPEAELFAALVMGIRDFAQKNRIGRAFLGLSGGVDSAVVAALATHALGPGQVNAVAVPSRHTDPRSTESARQLAATLGIAFEVLPLEPLHASAEEALGDLLSGGTCDENLQARLRAVVLMSFVNRHGGMLLNTSNKTELSLGYATLYGDSCGSLCPLGDLTKPEVYALARWINRGGEVIPGFILERPPTAELRPGQVDPFDYDEVAPRLERLVRADLSDAAMRRAEHKRRQMGVILAVGPRPFGPGRLIPITRR